MYFDTNVNKKERKRIVLTGFRGVDAASPIYKVDNKRAAAMRNFISINGNNHKRPGWKQVGRIKDSEGNALAINGFFKFTIAQQEVNIIYAGNKFFMKKDGAYCDMSLQTTITNNIDSARLQNREAQMVMDDNKAYFFGMGDYLVLYKDNGEFQFKRVYNHENTYIPTTTTNIPPRETDYYEDGSVVSYGDAQTVRDVNVLQSIRRNELIGSNYSTNKSTGELYADADIASNFNAITRQYQLDGKYIDSNNFIIHASHFRESNGRVYNYDIVLGDRKDTDASDTWLRFDTSVKRLHSIGTWNGTLQTYVLIKAGDFLLEAKPNGGNHNDLRIRYTKNLILDNSINEVATAIRADATSDYVISWGTFAKVVKPVNTKSGNYTVEEISDSCRPNKLNITMSDVSMQTYYLCNADAPDDATPPTIASCEPGERKTWGTINLDSGLISLYVNPHTIAGESNIVVEFSVNSGEDATEKVLGCSFGTMFGVKGSANTLFLSGNASCPNYDFWSNAEDLTYFPSNNLCRVGTSNTAIKGYQQLGDETLAIFKEDKGIEPTLYVRTGTATTIDKETISVTTGYYVTAGKYITEGAVSNKAIGMLNGEAIFLSKNGVFGVQVSSDSLVAENRVARERSRLINPILTTHTNLSQAVSIVHDNRYYLAIDGYVYVADARYMFSQNGDMADTFNYEWWVWENCPVRMWFERDDELWFGTEDGRICKFDNTFTDRKYEEFGAVSIGDTLEDGVNRVVYTAASVAGGLEDDDLVYFKGTSIYRLLFDADEMTANTDVTSENYKKITVSETNIGKIGTGTVVYADTITGGSLVAGTKYYVSDIDLEECTFKLTDAEGNYITPGSAFRLLIDLNGEILKVKTGTNEGTTYFTVRNRNAEEDDEYSLVTYNSDAISANAYKYLEENVIAEWVTPSFDMGANDYIKTLTRFSLATEQVLDGAVTFGYETKNKIIGLKEIDSRGLDVFSFDNLNFGKFTFSTGFDSAFTRSVKSDFNFIVFRFKSDNPYDCCVHALTVEYKVNRRNKGVF